MSLAKGHEPAVANTCTKFKFSTCSLDTREDPLIYSTRSIICAVSETAGIEPSNFSTKI